MLVATVLAAVAAYLFLLVVGRVLGTEAFARLRIGIDRRSEDLVDHVLGKFSAAERRTMEEAYIDAARGVAMWLTSGIEKCMNEFNG